MSTALVLALPWILAAVVVPLLLRRGPRLSAHTPRAIEDMPRASIIVPARNEAANIGGCLASLLNSTYVQAGRCEVIVVDDESTDGTGELARALAERSGGVLRVIAGDALPPGWVGKPWACWQGYRAADGEVLLFTDADTLHEPELLAHAVAGLLRERADLLTVIARQVMGTFWEKLVMPQVLLMIFARYPDPGRVARTGNPRDAIANGQFILVRRDAYEAIGGHQAVRGEIVEDLRLAQRLVQHGRRLVIAFAEDLLATRMYRSLGQMVEGWTKNLAMGTRASVEGAIRVAAPWLIVLFLLAFWVAPATVLVGGFFTGLGGTPFAWAAFATAASILFWALIHSMLGAPVHYAPLYPIGAAFAAGLFTASALRGPRVVWRGRRYGAPEEERAA